MLLRQASGNVLLTQVGCFLDTESERPLLISFSKEKVTEWQKSQRFL
jgi:hypothetical protein